MTKELVSKEGQNFVLGGMNCTWWDVSNEEGSIDVCPYCGGPLMRYDTFESYFSVLEKAGESDYGPHFINRLRGICFEDVEDAAEAIKDWRMFLGAEGEEGIAWDLNMEVNLALDKVLGAAQDSDAALLMALHYARRILAFHLGTVEHMAVSVSERVPRHFEDVIQKENHRWIKTGHLHSAMHGWQTPNHVMEGEE